MEKQQFNRLYEQWRSEKMTAEEWSVFCEAAADPANQHLLEAAIENDLQREEFDKILSAAEKSEAVSRIMRSIEPVSTIPPVHRVHFLRRWWAAAAILGAISTGIYFLANTPRNAIPEATVAKITDISPGKNGALLSLADGSQVNLDTIKNGVVALQGGITAKVVNGRLHYEGTDNKAVLNTISIPKGRQYDITLADGSRVWLNSASSITFPTSFVGNMREVTISGEAYFEVAANAASPFRVQIPGKVTVDVLGTHFNINAYNNEPSVNTTLLTGSVKVRNNGSANTSGAQAVVLKPGQQARVTPATVNITSAEIDKVMAWRNGAFNFEDVTLEEAMRQIERWYDIDVVIEKGVSSDLPFYGKISRTFTLQKLIKVLEQTELKFRIEQDRKLIITK
jgi:ferric-dicitrate binding protein FerR (iron transport regulator)